MAIGGRRNAERPAGELLSHDGSAWTSPCRMTRAGCPVGARATPPSPTTAFDAPHHGRAVLSPSGLRTGDRTGGPFWWGATFRPALPRGRHVARVPPRPPPARLHVLPGLPADHDDPRSALRLDPMRDVRAAHSPRVGRTRQRVAPCGDRGRARRRGWFGSARWRGVGVRCPSGASPSPDMNQNGPLAHLREPRARLTWAWSSRARA